MKPSYLDDAATIADFLGSDNVERIRTEFTNLIINNIEDSVSEYYILCPSDVNDEIEKIILSAKKTVIKNRKDEITKAIEKKLNDYVDKILEGFEEEK